MANNKPKFRLAGNFKDWSKLVAPDVKEAGDKLRDKIADSVPDDVPVEVYHGNGRDGRPVAIVTVKHPSGLPRQAKRGNMTKAAAELGLEVTRYPPKQGGG